MANKYLLRPKMATIKQTFFLDDENGNTIYEGKMTKFSLFGKSPYEFTNFKTNKVEEHVIGKTITIGQGGNDIISFMSTRSFFKFDGQNIWNYLHDLGVRINSNPSASKIGMTYEVSFEGNNIATIATSTPKGKSLITTDIFYDVTCEEKDLDIVFLVAFSIARTEQTFYD